MNIIGQHLTLFRKTSRGLSGISLFLLFFIFTSSIFAQEHSSPAQQLLQQASAESDTLQKIALLKSAIQKHPQFVDVRLELAKILIVLKKFDDALLHLDASLNRNNKNADVWYYKGLAHHKLGKKRTGLGCIRRAITLGNKAQYHLTLGKIYFDSGQFPKASLSFKQADSLTLNPTEQAKTKYWFGRLTQAQGDTTKAASFYRQTLIFNPNHTEAKKLLSVTETQNKLNEWYDIAEDAFNNQEWETAAEYYTKVVDLQNDYNEAQEKLKLAQDKIKALTQHISKEKITDTDSSGLIKTDPPILGDEKSRKEIPPIRKNSSIFEQNPIAVFATLVTLFVLLILFSTLKFANRNIQKTKNPVVENAIKKIEQPPSIILQDIFKSWQEPSHEPLTLQIDKYKLEYILGKGGMGVVYKAYDTILERPVALKVIHPELVNSQSVGEQLVDRFHEEAKTYVKLDKHENIVSLYDLNKSNDKL